MALSEASKEAVYLSRFLADLGFPSSSETKVATDNSAARDLAYNPEHHEKTKHIERRHFYVRELVEDHEIVVPFVRTVDNMADFFTKPLTASQFFKLRNLIMNHSPAEHSSARRASARSLTAHSSAGGCCDMT